jgi:hypothetical protein
VDRSRAATFAVVASSLAVALLASRPRSPLTPPLPRGAEAPEALSRGAEVLALDRLPNDVAAALSALLLFAAAGAFLYALREAWRGSLAVGRVVAVGIVLHLLVLVTPLFLSRDVYSYGIYGRMVSEYGVNPFVTTPAAFQYDPIFPFVSEDWRDSPPVYGPGFVVLSAGVTSLASTPASIVWAFKLIAVLAGVGTMFLVVASARRVRPQRAAFAAALVGWNPVVLFHGVAGGHNDALVGLAIAGAVFLLLSGKEVAASAVLVLGSVVKVTAAIPLLVMLGGYVVSRPVGERLRELVRHAGVGALVALPFVLPFMQTKDPTLGSLELSTRQGWLAPSVFLWNLFRGLGRLLGVPAAGTAVGFVVRFGFVAILIAVIAALVRHLAREPGRITPTLLVAAMGWAMLVALLTSPLLLPWYAASAMPLAWLLPRVPRFCAVFLAVVLTITELIAEPASSPPIWEAMVIGLHWVASPLALVILGRLLLELRRGLAIGPAEGASDPLLIEHLPAPPNSGFSSRARSRGVAGHADEDGGPDSADATGRDAHAFGADRAED